MPYCRHCGKPVEGGSFCSSCGGPLAPGAVDALAAKLNRHRNQMILIALALGLFFAVTVGLVVHRVMRVERATGLPLTVPPAVGETSTPVAPPPQPPSVAAQNPPVPQSPQPLITGGNNPSSRSSTTGIDPREVQNAVVTLTQNGKQRTPSPQQPSAPPAVSAGSDRYPGSQPIEVKDANLPDIGVPVASEVYSTTDSVSTVVAYYTQRYSDAEVMEVSGQKVLAIDRPGATKVIAIGTTGTETRIAIIKQAN